MNKKFIRKIKSKDKKRKSPYANIDWEKAKELFKQPINLPREKSLFPSTEQILHILATTGAIGMTFAFPKAGANIGSLLLGDDSYSNYRTNQVLSRLTQRKYVTIGENDDNSTTVKITKNGMVRALTYKVNSMIIKKPKRWDRKWRVVTFDIPDKYRRVRDVFRERLQQLNLYRLQDSVYISPYPCFNEIEFLRELYGVSFNIQYLLVEKLEDDVSLRSYFGL